MKRFAVFGNPIEHSISPKIHNSAYKALSINASYTKQKLENGAKLKEFFYKLNLSGANVTVPHKEIAFKQCDEIKGIAKQIKAINTIVKTNASLTGYNTDAPGFLMAIDEFFPLQNALILGAGGTAKAIACALLEKGLHVSLVNRSENRLLGFKNFNIQTFTWNTFKADTFDIIINTTSAGLNDNSLPLPKELLLSTIKKSKFAFDVIYHKETPFLELCTQSHLTCKNGKDMLLYQGVLAFNLFFENIFNIKQISQPMKAALLSQ